MLYVIKSKGSVGKSGKSLVRYRQRRRGRNGPYKVPRMRQVMGCFQGAYTDTSRQESKSTDMAGAIPLFR